MAIVYTRPLSKRDRFAFVAIKIPNLEFYRNKTGVLLVTITNVAWGQTITATAVANGCGDITIMPSSHVYDDPVDSGYAIVPKINLTNTQGSSTGTWKFAVAVNNGAMYTAQLNDDGSVDLLYALVRLTEDYPAEDGFTVQVTYNITWTELTPVSTPSINGTIITRVANSQFQDINFVVTDLAAQFNGGNLTGYVLLQIVDTVYTINDTPKHSPFFGRLAGRLDGSPYVALSNSNGPVGTPLSFFTNYVPKSSGTRTYDELTCLVYAVNNGKIDDNGTMIKNQAISYAILAVLNLFKSPQAPSDDDVKCQLDYFLTLANL